jgi:hypothetical protein
MVKNNVSAYAARQQVDSFILDEVSYMMHAGEPSLLFGERIFWRVPVVLSLTSRGVVGEVGTIAVDVESGQIHVSPDVISEICARAEGLALHTPERFSPSEGSNV